tara:strand:- start:404 stop:955 length:552 start_codon:yes stop_codon:yes gene_type:complete
MRFTLIIILFFFFVTSKAYSDLTKQIINNLENSENYIFKFTQQVNDKKETGNCVLVFDKKINCKYDNLGKILISDGKNIIIKSNNSDIPNFYKLENTSFYKLLDKRYLINELKMSNIKNQNDKIFVRINYQNFDIKVFFDKEKLYLKGWQTKDIYNNFVFTEIKILSVNEIIDENLFNLQRFY